MKLHTKHTQEMRLGITKNLKKMVVKNFPSKSHAEDPWLVEAWMCHLTHHGINNVGLISCLMVGRKGVLLLGRLFESLNF